MGAGGSCGAAGGLVPAPLPDKIRSEGRAEGGGNTPRVNGLGMRFGSETLKSDNWRQGGGVAPHAHGGQGVNVLWGCGRLGELKKNNKKMIYYFFFLPVTQPRG